MPREVCALCLWYLHVYVCQEMNGRVLGITNFQFVSANLGVTKFNFQNITESATTVTVT